MAKKKRKKRKIHKDSPEKLQFAPYAVRLTDAGRRRLYVLAGDANIHASEWLRRMIDRSYEVSHPFDTETEEG